VGEAKQARRLGAAIAAALLAATGCGDGAAGDEDAAAGSGADAGADAAATTTCGPGAPDPGGECPDAGDEPPTCDGGPCAVGSAVYRMSNLALRDPHVYLQIPVFGCRDVTDSAPLSNRGVNEQFEDAITGDEDGDGFLDLSFLLLFRGEAFEFVEGRCTAPMGSTSCEPDGEPEATTYTDLEEGTCLDPHPGTTTGYSPAIATPQGPCFSTASIDLALDIQGTEIPLSDAQLGATYVGDPPASLADGLVRGFISEAEADTIVLTVNGGDHTLSSLLPGGTGNCRNGDDRDLGLDGTTVGWWFYLNFPAVEVPYTEP
jgi:hypothetical protein